ncbi:hypothetical protein ACFMQL_41415 [Nonomuraea fastidiosa]|uniref:hypothetical protein n=1 Tax=Nonomuraea fastidiosa TaxID=46173 RepID=UPI00366B8C44
MKIDIAARRCARRGAGPFRRGLGERVHRGGHHNSFNARPGEGEEREQIALPAAVVRRRVKDVRSLARLMGGSLHLNGKWQLLS